MKQERLDYLPAIWFSWLGAYLFLVPLATRGGTSFLAAPVDWPFPIWFKLVFLNVPLQILVIGVALVLLKRSKAGQPSPPALWFSVAATTLIGVNLVVALWCRFLT